MSNKLEQESDLKRRRFLKYASASAAFIGVSALGLNYLGREPITLTRTTAEQIQETASSEVTASRISTVSSTPLPTNKGKVFQSEIFRYADTSTKREIWRVTDPEVLSYGAYFYQRSISRNNTFAVFRSDRTGLMNIYRVDLPSGSITQLTDEKWHIRDFVLSPDDKEVIYWGISAKGNRAVKALDLADLSERTVYEVPDEWVYGSQIGLSSDGRYAVITEMRKDYEVTDWTDWSSEEEQWARMPLCRIVMMSTDGSDSRVVHEENYWLDHPQIRPGDNETIMYCHAGPSNKIDAEIWFVNNDGSSVRCPRPQTKGEEILHEYWLADGSKIAYVHYPSAESWHESVGAATIRFLDIGTLREEVLMRCPGCLHFSSNKDNSEIVRDSRTDPFIYLVDVYERKEEPLCRHDTSWKWYGEDSQAAHPHPSFSPDGRLVLFSSDKDGLPAVYVVEID